MTLLEFALRYFELGFHPIPVAPGGKQALVSWRAFQTRAPSRREVGSWFTAKPAPNVGLVTGHASGIIAIDCDTRAAEATLAQLVPLPLTPVNITANGSHWLFKHPGRVVKTTTGVLPGIDVRGDGGYIVVPPSIHPSGWQYRWDEQSGHGLETPLASLPEGLNTLLFGAPPTSETIEDELGHETSNPEPIREGTRNDTLTRIAGKLLGGGLSTKKVLADCLRINAQRCAPPLNEDEVRRIVESIAQRETLKPPAGAASKKRVHGLSLNTRRLDSVKSETMQWLWLGYVPRGGITIFDGSPGVGKSTFTLDLASRVSTGQTMPDGSPGAQGHVLLLNIEDSISRTVVPRLSAMQGDTSRIAAIDTVQLSDGTARLPHLPEDLPLVRAMVRKHGTRLIIVDPLSAFLSPNVNSWSDQHVRTALAPLGKLAEDEQLAVIVVRHPTKNRDASPLEAGSGSMAIIAAARSAFYMGRDPQDDNQVVIAPLKQNLSVAVPSLAFRIVTADNGAARIHWLGTSLLDAQALRPAPRDVVDKLDAAEEILKKLLSEGPRPQRVIEERAKEQGVSGATLKRAKAKLGVIAKKVGFGANGIWNWELPATSALTSIPDVSPLALSSEELPSTEEIGTKNLNPLNPRGSVEEDKNVDSDDESVECFLDN
jgi:hypothetical protein